MVLTVHKLTIKVKRDLVGLVIGKGGCRIEEIKRDTNTRVYFGTETDQNGEVQCTIIGQDFKGVQIVKVKISAIIVRSIRDDIKPRKVFENISACENLEENLNFVLRVHHTLVPLLIGKGGCRIKEITHGSKSRIVFGRVPDENGNVECCITSNDLASQERTKMMLDNYIQKLEENCHYGGNLCFLLRIHHKLVPHLIGKNGLKIKEISQGSKSEIRFGKETDGFGYVDCLIRAREVASKEKAKKMIQKFLTELRMKISDKNWVKKKVLKKKKKPKGGKLVEEFQPVSNAVALRQESLAAKPKRKIQWKGNKSCWRCGKKFGKYTDFGLPMRHSAKCVKLGNSVAAFQRNITTRMNKLDSKCEWSGGCDICGSEFLEVSDYICHLEGRDKTIKANAKGLCDCLEGLCAPIVKNSTSKPNLRNWRFWERPNLVANRQMNCSSIKFIDFELNVSLEI